MGLRYDKTTNESWFNFLGESVMNWPLFSAISTIASGVTIGVLMTIMLVLEMDTIPLMIGVCVIGFLLSLPIAWVVAKKMQSLGIVKSKNNG